MAKIPVILEAGRADGKLTTSDAIFDENKGMFQSEINDIQDTLNSDNTNKPLSAKQGKVLKELLDAKVIETGAVPIDSEPIEGNTTHVVSSDGLAKEFNKCNTAIINTDRIEDGAVTSEKIATSAFDDTLSVSGKIAPADVVGTKLNQLDTQINGEKSKSYQFSESVGANSWNTNRATYDLPFAIDSNTPIKVSRNNVGSFPSTCNVKLYDESGTSYDFSLKGDILEVTRSIPNVVTKYSFLCKNEASETANLQINIEEEIEVSGGLKKTVEECASAINENTTAIDKINNSLSADIDGKIVASKNVGKWIKYTDGSLNSTGNYTECYTIINDGYRTIDVVCKLPDRTPAVIAFYTDTPSTTTYIKDKSVQYDTTNNKYSVSVPENAKYILVLNNTNLLPNCSILLKSFVTKKLSVVTEKNAIDIDAIKESYYNQFVCSPCYAHLFIEYITQSNVRPVVPSQSLFDIEVSARLGYKYIELNVQKTIDGVLIPYHGSGGKFSKEVCDKNGTFQYADTPINTVTYSWIKENLVYFSKYSKHATYIPTLEEALCHCKKHGIKPMLYFTEESYMLAKKHFGDNFIASDGNRNDGFTGIIAFYSALNTVEGVLSFCESIGKPYIHLLQSGALRHFIETNTLKELCQTLHENGYLVGIVGSYETPTSIETFLSHGGDVVASGYSINDFEYGNICNYSSEVNFDDYLFSDGNVVDGVLNLSDGGTISTIELSNVFLGKGSLRIRFNGHLKFESFGHSRYTNLEINSDGAEEMWFSTYFLEKVPSFKLVSIGDTSIFDLSYKASKV